MPAGVIALVRQLVPVGLLPVRAVDIAFDVARRHCRVCYSSRTWLLIPSDGYAIALEHPLALVCMECRSNPANVLCVSVLEASRRSGNYSAWLDILQGIELKRTRLAKEAEPSGCHKWRAKHLARPRTRLNSQAKLAIVARGDYWRCWCLWLAGCVCARCRRFVCAVDGLAVVLIIPNVVRKYVVRQCRAPRI